MCDGLERVNICVVVWVRVVTGYQPAHDPIDLNICPPGSQSKFLIEDSREAYSLALGNQTRLWGGFCAGGENQDIQGKCIGGGEGGGGLVSPGTYMEWFHWKVGYRLGGGRCGFIRRVFGLRLRALRVMREGLAWYGGTSTVRLWR